MACLFKKKNNISVKAAQWLGSCFTILIWDSFQEKKRSLLVSMSSVAELIWNLAYFLGVGSASQVTPEQPFYCHSTKDCDFCWNNDVGKKLVLEMLGGGGGERKVGQRQTRSQAHPHTEDATLSWNTQWTTIVHSSTNIPLIPLQCC